MDNKTKKINELQSRYGACEDAITSIDIMLGGDKLLKKAVGKIYKDNTATSELAETRTTIKYDLIAMKDEIQDISIEIAEELNEQRKE